MISTMIDNGRGVRGYLNASDKLTDLLNRVQNACLSCLSTVMAFGTFDFFFKPVASQPVASSKKIVDRLIKICSSFY